MPSHKKPKPKKKQFKLELSKPQIYIISGVGLLVLGLTVLGATYLPMFWANLKYYLLPHEQVVVVAEKPAQLDPQKKFEFAKYPEFGIVISKIHANTQIIANVNPFKPEVYQEELSKGVAHAQGTALPNQDGTVFLFAHSAGDISKARQYNAVFYLLDKLEVGDEIDIFYKNQKYKYKVTKHEVVEPDQVQYLKSKDPKRQLILMTCTPAGTTRHRLLVHADLVPSQD
jgi:LPXTG-site transpeptidase (sortase) family protein